MNCRPVFLAGVATMLALAPVVTPASAFVQRGADSVQSEQDMVFQNRAQGRVMPLRQIERRVTSRMGGADYLGNPIYFERSNTYRMSFMRSGQVIHVEVNAQSGRILSRSDR